MRQLACRRDCLPSSHQPPTTSCQACPPHTNGRREGGSHARGCANGSKVAMVCRVTEVAPQHARRRHAPPPAQPLQQGWGRRRTGRGLEIELCGRRRPCKDAESSAGPACEAARQPGSQAARQPGSQAARQREKVNGREGTHLCELLGAHAADAATYYTSTMHKGALLACWQGARKAGLLRNIAGR